eukprot:TRINITY_DN67904_c4_g1_i4.p2 TRINITY_DN67904_c4_g1~~TRINITY_DN67904_c4_g1_i4.p2  ORF type:complete len:225 (-),score=8.98 TRINITY_DN67904_c4_g1_i4:2032-2706(-)
MNHFLFVGLLLCTWPTVPSDACSCSSVTETFNEFCTRAGWWGHYGSAVYTIREEMPNKLPPGLDADEHSLYRATIDEVLVQDTEKHLRVGDTIISGGEVECCACGIPLDINATYVGLLNGWGHIYGYQLDKFVWGTSACTPKTNNLTKKHDYVCPGLEAKSRMAENGGEGEQNLHALAQPEDAPAGQLPGIAVWVLSPSLLLAACGRLIRVWHTPSSHCRRIEQ